MVLVAFVLVLLAAASFAAGIAASRTSDTLVYLSIAFSLGAFVTLAIASLRARQAARAVSDDQLVAAPARTIDETEAHAGPLLGGLDPTQLDMTPTWRRQSRRRPPEPEPVIADEEDEDLDAQLENEEDEADFEVPVAPVAAARDGDEFWWGDEEEDDQDRTAAFNVSLDEFDEDDDDDDESALDIPEPEPEPEPAASGDGSFYDLYDDMTAAEILPFLGALDLDGLQWVRDRERGGAKRATVVNQVEQLIVERGGRPAGASTRKRATSKTAAAKKAAPARRATKKSTRRR